MTWGGTLPGEAGLLAARRRWIGVAGQDSLPRVLLAAGWTEDTYRVIAGLAEHAVAVHAPVVEDDTNNPRLAGADRLAWLAEAATLSEAPIEQVLPWVALLAGATDPRLSLALRTRLIEWDDEYVEDENVLAPGLASWAVRLGARLAPLAYVAGLSIEEAETRRAVGTLTESELRTLAGLRGWALPSLL